MLAGATQLTGIWKIRLIQHDKNKTCFNAVEKLLIYFPRSQSTKIPASDKYPEQCVINLKVDHRCKQQDKC